MAKVEFQFRDGVLLPIVVLNIHRVGTRRYDGVRPTDASKLTPGKTNTAGIKHQNPIMSFNT